MKGFGGDMKRECHGFFVAGKCAVYKNDGGMVQDGRVYCGIPIDSSVL